MIARTIIVLIVAVVVSNLIVFGWHMKDRHDAETQAIIARVIERMVFPVGVLAGTDPAARTEIAPTLQGRFRRVWLTEASMKDGFAPPFGVFSDFRKALEAEMNNLGISEVYFGLFDAEEIPRFARRPGWRHRGMHHMYPEDRPRDGLGPRGGGWDVPERFLVVSAELASGQWVNVATPFDPRSMGWNLRMPLGFLFSMLLVLIVTVLVVRRVGKPIRIFTEAAERLGRDVNAPPLDENKGPGEVRRGARAFNEMQRRLRAFIEDRTRMLAAVSHDLRTPITRMKLRAEFVEDDEQREKMLKDLDEMEAMIAATLAFAKEDVASEESRSVDLAALVVALVEDMAEAGDDIAYSGPDSMPFEGRPVALKRALSNLMINAVKYGKRARVSFDETEGWAVITVDDDGPGISEDQQDKVFDPFYRVETSRNRETGGTGLGLSVVRSVVTAHGGEVLLKNRAEGGLRAVIRMPIAR